MGPSWHFPIAREWELSILILNIAHFLKRKKHLTLIIQQPQYREEHMEDLSQCQTICSGTHVSLQQWSRMFSELHQTIRARVQLDRIYPSSLLRTAEKLVQRAIRIP